MDSQVSFKYIDGYSSLPSCSSKKNIQLVAKKI